MKKIIIITSGGTIAMEKGQAEGTVTGADYLSVLPELNRVGEIHVFAWKNIASKELQLPDILDLAKILKQHKETGFDGAVITHGTDPMEETAYLLDLVTDLDMGVVITGAQRVHSHPGRDGLSNILDAAIVAADPRSAEEGVLLVFNGKVHTARDVAKTHTTCLDTFKSLEFGPLAGITNMRVHWYRSDLMREYYQIDKIDCRVEIVRAFLGSDDLLIKLLLQDGIDGLVIEGTGAGHFPDKMLEGIQDAVSEGIPVVLTSRCTGRLLTDTYGGLTGRGLQNIGIIFGDALPAIKARLKLMVLLSSGLSLSEIRYHFEKHFYMDKKQHAGAISGSRKRLSRS